MSILPSRLVPVALLAAAALALAGCATPTTPGSPGGGSTPDVEPVDVVGQGMVIQIGDAPAQLCLGAIMESYPPQCSGPELLGWDWTQAEGQETSGDVTWGMYAVWGKWNGTNIVLDSQIQLALYDPMPIEDPALDPDNAGTTPEQDLLDIESTTAETFPVEVLSSRIENGYLFVEVLSDDGAIQEWADAEYGPDVVQVRPALRVVG